MLLALTLALAGCATASAGHWAPNEWKPENASAANVPEPPLPTKTAATASTNAPAPKEAAPPAPVAPPTQAAPSPPVATLPESAPIGVAEPPTETKPAVDQAQLSRERAKAAIVLVDNASSGVRAAVCSARSLLEQVPDVYRQEPLVVDAQKRIKAKEPAALREEVTEFKENQMYLCRDNTPSPTCYCNGPKRGCCSHHGGVAGCEPLPTTFTCP